MALELFDADKLKNFELVQNPVKQNYPQILAAVWRCLTEAHLNNFTPFFSIELSLHNPCESLDLNIESQCITA